MCATSYTVYDWFTDLRITWNFDHIKFNFSRRKDYHSAILAANEYILLFLFTVKVTSVV